MSLADSQKIESPKGAETVERERLHSRFASRVSINEDYSRRVVSYQGNRDVPGLRWMKYKEGFSRQLVLELIEKRDPQAVLDPFAGICTTPLVAAGSGRGAMGIEIMPVGILAGTAIAEASNGILANDLDREARALVEQVRQGCRTPSEFAFPHVRITECAFPKETEEELARARAFLSSVKEPGLRDLLNLACLSVLEESSYTRKDGQYLRWDSRSGRRLRAKMHKGPIAPFSEALERRLAEMKEDVDALKQQYGGGYPNLVTGSCLELLKDVPAESYDMVITSPPYANRYDYTRTYALELAWMGLDQGGFSALRQQMLSATVENKDKLAKLSSIYGESRHTLDAAIRMYAEQGALHEVLHNLLECAHELSNRQILRLIECYFFEMALVVAELGRIVQPGGVVIMVNDNVQYHGEELPVDFILADFAERSGFKCTNIWMLRRGKGNSSQQMARFGRRELRKCVYEWVRTDG